MFRWSNEIFVDAETEVGDNDVEVVFDGEDHDDKDLERDPLVTKL